MRHTALWPCTHIPNKYYLNFFLFDLEVKGSTKVITVRDTAVWSFTHTKYILFHFFYLEVKGQGPTKVITVRDTPPYGHAPTYQISLTYLISKDKNVMARTRKYYLKNNYLTLRSRSHEGHYGMRHTAFWSYTHIPNIIDLSGKTNKLWSGQASLRRRSGRKNQTKTICLPSFEGET